MDGVVHPNVEQAIGRDRIRKALKRYENRPADEHRYGIVRSVNEDGSYEVLLDGDVQTSRCAKYGTALVGDRVLAVTKKDGRNDLIGRLGGEIGGGGGGSSEGDSWCVNPADYVAEWGNTGIWSWCKWASGKAECWGKQQYSPQASEWQGHYMNVTTVSLPFEFSSVLDARVAVTANGNNIVYGSVGSITNTQITYYHSSMNDVISGTSQIYVMGTWKTPPASGGTSAGYFENATVKNELEVGGDISLGGKSVSEQIAALENAIQQGGGGTSGGTVFTPYVSPEGVISWSNNGDLVNPTPVNIKGQKGDKGDTGATGAAGSAGARGTGILKITTALTAYTTETGGVTPAYRVTLSTVQSESNVPDPKVGDIIQRSYYQYPIIYVDGSYCYTGARTSIRGSAGAAGADGKMLYGSCSTAAGTAAKTVTIDGFELSAGVCVAIKFSNANTAASPTLNVSSTGAKAIRLNGQAYAYWVAGATVNFVYDGTYWQVCSVPVYAATATIGNPSSQNVYIDGDSVDVRNGTTVNASFSSDKIELGKNSEGSVIEMCNAKAAIEADEWSPGIWIGRFKGLHWAELYGENVSRLKCSSDETYAEASLTGYLKLNAEKGINISLFDDAMSGSLEDWVVAQSIVANSDAGKWSWRKWASGKAECWVMGYLLTTDGQWTLTRGMYVSNNSVSYTCPFTFKDEAKEFAVLRAEVGYPGFIQRKGSLSTTKTATYGVALAEKVSGWDMGHKFYIYRVGRWK